MDKHSILKITAVFLVFGFLCGCELKPLGLPGKSSKANISEQAMRRVLGSICLDTPYVISASRARLQRGKSFHERIRDRRGRWTLLTIWLDRKQRNMLHVQTMRTATCPVCNGTGTRKLNNNLKVDLRCLKCKGAGKIEDYFEVRKFLLSADDFVSSGSLAGDSRYKLADNYPEVRLSPQEEKYIADLASKDSAVRVAALRWLDTNYVRVGVFFQGIMPMLRKAVWIETNKKKNITVYQFRAGKEEIPKRAYFRIFVNDHSGKVKDKGFISIAELRQGNKAGAKTRVMEKTNSVQKWFTGGWK